MTPILRGADTAASIHYYISALGFDLDWQDPRVGFASASCGKCHLYRGDQGHPGNWIWVGKGGADALLQEYRSSGAKIRHLPTNYPWAYEMQVEDLDRNVLRLASEPKENEPTGEWLDMHGRRWPPPDGGSKPDQTPNRPLRTSRHLISRQSGV